MKYNFKGIMTLLNAREKHRFYRLILFDVVISALDILFLAFLLMVVGFYTSGLPAKLHLLISGKWFSKNSLWLIALFMLLFCCKNWLGYVIMRFQHHFFYDVASRLSKRNILHYFNADYMQFVNVDSSIHIRQISQQPVEFSHYILNNTQQVIAQTILIVFTITAILLYQPLLFILLLILLVPPVTVLSYFIRRKSKQVRVNTKLASEKTIQHLQESLSGFVESNIYNKSSFLAERYTGYQEKLNHNLAAQQTLQGLPARLVEVFAIFGFFVLVLINKWANGAVVDVLTIGVFMAAAYKIIPGIIKILNSSGQIKTYEFILDDLLKISKPDQPTLTSELKNIAQPINYIRFQNVSFSYKDQEVINSINFEICSGDFVGISAASGRGKTTLVNLLLGFLSHDAGYIYINYKEADTATRNNHLKYIAYIKQQTFFIHDTILKNITLSDDECNPGKLAEVIEFCKLGPLLANYPEGIDYIIRENGKNLSGGQRQRIMLARALYHDFNLLILDEPFSEMDQRAEEEILIQLQSLALEGKIILFITHHAASLAYCNKVITLND